MKLASVVICSNLLFWSVPLAAAPAPESSAPKPTAAEKKICKSVGEDVIGTKFGKTKICKTAAQWQQEAEKQKNSKGGSRGS